MTNIHISANLNRKCLILRELHSTSGAPQYELISFVTMATYWVSDLPNAIGFSGLFSILLSANGASCT